MFLIYIMIELNQDKGQGTTKNSLLILDSPFHSARTQKQFKILSLQHQGNTLNNFTI